MALASTDGWHSRRSSLAGSRGEGGRKNPLVVERPRRRIVGKEHLLEDRRQSEVRIKQRRRYALAGFGARNVVSVGPHIEVMTVKRKMKRQADVKRPDADAESRGGRRRAHHRGTRRNNDENASLSHDRALQELKQ